MAAVAVAVDRAPGETIAVAIDAGGQLVDLAIERPGRIGVGDVLRGRVTARVPALAGAFVALPGVAGFLPDSAGGRILGDGDTVAVRVTRAPIGGKGPRLEVAAAPASPRAGPGALARITALHPGAREVAWDESLGDQIAALSEPAALLPGGGRLHVSPTPGLTALDVDLGEGAAERSGKTRAHVVGNLAAFPEIARQIRLRELCGAIVLDLAGLSLRRRAALGPALAAALADDPRARFLGFTALGLAEILRAPLHTPLHELLSGPHAAALRAARDWVRAASGPPARRLALRAAPDLLAALTSDPALCADLRDRLGEPPEMRADPLAGQSWRLEAV